MAPLKPSLNLQMSSTVAMQAANPQDAPAAPLPSSLLELRRGRSKGTYSEAAGTQSAANPPPSKPSAQVPDDRASVDGRRPSTLRAPQPSKWKAELGGALGRGSDSAKASLPAHVKACWCCPLCNRRRDARNQCPGFRPDAVYLPFKDESAESPCSTCTNYLKGPLKGTTLRAVKANLRKDPAKRSEYQNEIQKYEQELEASISSGVHRNKCGQAAAAKANPPVIVEAFSASSHKASLILPNFWEQGLYNKKYPNDPLPDSRLDSYTFRGRKMRGYFLCRVEYPAITGVYTLKDKEEHGATKSQFISNSSNGPKQATQEVLQLARDATGHELSFEMGADGNEDVKIKRQKVLKGQLSEASNASSDMEWLNILGHKGEGETVDADDGEGSDGRRVAAKVSGSAKAKAKGKSSKPKAKAKAVPRVPSPAPSSSPSAASGNRAADAPSQPTKVYYPSSQDRDVAKVNVTLTKIPPLLAMVGDQEAIQQLTVAKVDAVMKELQKLNTPEFRAKLVTAREPKHQDIQQKGERAAQNLEKSFGEWEALQYLMRSIAASGPEDGLFWSAESIVEGIQRCSDRGISLCPWVHAQHVMRKIQVLSGLDSKSFSAEQARQIIKVLAESSNGDAKKQVENVIFTVQMFFEDTSRDDSFIGILMLAAQQMDALNWILDGDFRDKFSELYTVWRMAEFSEMGDEAVRDTSMMAVETDLDIQSLSGESLSSKLDELQDRAGFTP